MFVNDGSYFASQAEAMHLGGDEWGVMNETGSYPGQPWLWLYTLWYGTSWGNFPNADLIAIYMTGAATVLLLLVPFIPRPAGHPAADPGAPAHLAPVERARR